MKPRKFTFKIMGREFHVTRSDDGKKTKVKFNPPVYIGFIGVGSTITVAILAAWWWLV